MNQFDKGALLGAVFGSSFTFFVFSTYIRNKYVLIPKKLN